MGLREMANVHSNHNSFRVLVLLFLLCLWVFIRVRQSQRKSHTAQVQYSNLANKPEGLPEAKVSRNRQSQLLKNLNKLIVQCPFWTVEKPGPSSGRACISAKRSSTGRLLLECFSEDCSKEGDDVVQLFQNVVKK